MSEETKQPGATEAEIAALADDYQDLGRELVALLAKLAEVERERDAERQLRDEARDQREWLIKECERIGVQVNVAIGAQATEAYQLVNNERQRAEAAEARVQQAKGTITQLEQQLHESNGKEIRAEAALTVARKALERSHRGERPCPEFENTPREQLVANSYHRQLCSACNAEYVLAAK